MKLVLVLFVVSVLAQVCPESGDEYDQDTDLQGHDLKQIHNIKSAHDCCAECSQSKKCRAFSWGAKATDPATILCWLKSSAAGKRALKGRVSYSLDSAPTPAPGPHAVDVVHLVFMNHLDVGYSNKWTNHGGACYSVRGGGHAWTAPVCGRDAYIKYHFPQALATIDTLRNKNSTERYIYSTKAWLLEEVLEYGSSSLGAAISEAAKRGDITWDALPLNGEPENSIGNSDLLR